MQVLKNSLLTHPLFSAKQSSVQEGSLALVQYCCSSGNAGHCLKKPEQRFAQNVQETKLIHSM